MRTVAVDEPSRGWIQNVFRRANLDDLLPGCHGGQQNATHVEVCFGHVNCVVPSGHPRKHRQIWISGNKLVHEV